MSTASTPVFENSRIFVGKFRCPTDHALWRTENCTGNWPCIAFPRVAVGIKQVGSPMVVATPNHAMLYNANHCYSRMQIDKRGDVCEYIALSPELIHSAFESCSIPHPRSLNAPFENPYCPCSSGSYLKQRALFEHLNRQTVDQFFVDEVLLEVVHEILAAGFQLNQSPHRNSSSRTIATQREQVVAAKEYISRNFRNLVKLDAVSRAANCSEFHLCRIFKKFSGLTIHQFLLSFRLRASLEWLRETELSITRIALELGFSSHSHFSTCFKKCFGQQPARFREGDAPTG